MKLAQINLQWSTEKKLGALIGERVLDVTGFAANGHAASWLGSAPEMLMVIERDENGLADIAELIDSAVKGDSAAEQFLYALDLVTFLPAVYPSKILAIGRNYVDHAIEGGSTPPTVPLIFNKLSNSLSAHDSPIVLHRISTQIDYEAELAVIIGRSAKKVSEPDALSYVFGYSLINDVSARDLQFGDGQWVRGKGLDGFAPLGPFITTRDEIPDVQILHIEGRLNGEVMQSSNTSKMIFGVAYLVSYISQGITLEPGDVIATGTPDGVGIFRKPPVLLKEGDVYEVSIEGLGTLRNNVISE